MIRYSIRGFIAPFWKTRVELWSSPWSRKLRSLCSCQSMSMLSFFTSMLCWLLLAAAKQNCTKKCITTTNPFLSSMSSLCPLPESDDTLEWWWLQLQKYLWWSVLKMPPTLRLPGVKGGARLFALWGPNFLSLKSLKKFRVFSLHRYSTNDFATRI